MTACRSLSVSNGSDLSRAGIGGERACGRQQRVSVRRGFGDVPVAITPLPPARFSITTGLPSRSCSFGAMARSHRVDAAARREGHHERNGAGGIVSAPMPVVEVRRPNSAGDGQHGSPRDHGLPPRITTTYIQAARVHAWVRHSRHACESGHPVRRCGTEIFKTSVYWIIRFRG